ncbi:MAG: PSP1 domain-containing protein [bacterium]
MSNYYVIHFLSFAREHIGVSDDDIKKGDICVATTDDGSEFCEVLLAISSLDVESIIGSGNFYKIRKASESDIERLELINKRRREAFEVCYQMSKARGLEMKLINVSIFPDGSKITFYYTAEGRIDFRELVKDLAGKFRTRIEMRQIGVRDEAQIIGGLGPCMLPICCTRFIRNFESINIQVAKLQGLNLSPSKISGLCGRLMCCLSFECDVYKCLLFDMPEIGSKVIYNDGEATVLELFPLIKSLMITTDGENNIIVPIDEIQYEKRELKFLPLPSSNRDLRESGERV